MKRRDFFALFGALRSHGRRAQQPDRLPEAQAWLDAFSQRLQQLGWTASHNIQLDYRWASPRDPDLRQRVARELAGLPNRWER